MKTKTLITFTFVILLSAFTTLAGEHTVNLEITVYHGAVGAHFSRYDGHKTVDGKVGPVGVSVPTFGSRFTKLASRDDSNSGDERRIVPGKPWILKDFKVQGAGTYILDLADWDDSPDVYVKLIIDGKLRFEGRGTANNYNGWSNKKFGEATRKTDDREIAIDISE